MSPSYDYIIVGAGAAGCVLAYRLTEDRDCNVLLLEAGGRDWHPLLKLPIAWTTAMVTPQFNWGFESEPDAHRGGRTLPLRARQDARRFDLDQRHALFARPFPRLRPVAAARQQGLGLCGRAAVFQAVGAKLSRREQVSRRRRPAERAPWEKSCAALRAFARRGESRWHSRNRGHARRRTGRHRAGRDDD